MEKGWKSGGSGGWSGSGGQVGGVLVVGEEREK